MKTILSLSLVCLVGCGGTSNQRSDGGTQPDGGACFESPQTSVELLNACTDADSVDKQPFYPTLAPGGVLPQLP